MSGRQALGLVLVAIAVVGTFVVPRVADENEPEGATHGCERAGEPDEVATLCLLNAERRRHGRAPLRRHSALRTAAVRHARDMADRDFFAHENPEGTGPHERILRTGYGGGRPRLTGENLAKGEREAGAASSIVDGWMHSPGHRTNILRRRFEEIGIAIVEDGDVAIYVTTFGARR